MRRALAAPRPAQRPDAFQPDVARSLAVLANCPDASGHREDAMAAAAEATATLCEPFQQHPAAFTRLMLTIIHKYLERCQKLGREPDMKLLAPVVAVFQALQVDGAKENTDQRS